MKKIQDDFTELKMSRQRKHQLRRKAKGMCYIGGCDKPHAPHSVFCAEHWAKERERMRKRLGCKRRFKTCLSYHAV
jgi:hypothetical protein